MTDPGLSYFSRSMNNKLMADPEFQRTLDQLILQEEAQVSGWNSFIESL